MPSTRWAPRPALLTGSGPTAVGLFPDLVAADRAAAALPPRFAAALSQAPRGPGERTGRGEQ